MFKKRLVVGVSLTPEAGLEVAQIDFATKKLIKYGRKPLDYNVIRRDIADFDLFKEALQDLLDDLNIPKGTELSFNIPTVLFKVTDYPASLDSFQIESAIESDLYESPYFKDFDYHHDYRI